MSLKKIILIIATALLAVGLAIVAAGAVTHQTGTDNTTYCVTFGHGPGAAGNNVLNDWDNTPCPPGTYPHTLKVNVKDDDTGLLPNIFFNNQNHSPTTWEIVDNAPATNGAAPIVYICQFGIPAPPAVNGNVTPTITCTRTS